MYYIIPRYLNFEVIGKKKFKARYERYSVSLRRQLTTTNITKQFTNKITRYICFVTNHEFEFLIVQE